MELRVPEIKGITIDAWQRRRLKLPKGDLKLADGRVMRRIIGYDLSKVPTNNEVTRNGFLESAGWAHKPSGFIVSAGLEDTARWGAMLHASFSYGDHMPSWDDVKVVREALFPMDMDTAMILPRQEDYVNVHPYCLHIWQIPEHWGLL